jgi:tRNA ligase
VILWPGRQKSSMTIAKLAGKGDDAELIAKLRSASEKQSKLGRPRGSEHKIWDKPDVKIIGWKFNEWDYGKAKVTLPSYARGLFTLGEKILVRGYDKFFNIGEVTTSSWTWIEEHCHGPYYLTLKENGCIVFLAGMEDGTLLVTSKHSTGPREGARNEENHSWVAKLRVESHLAKVGKSKRELANELYELNATAVGELCDDSFEEHILPYTEQKAGIYLHGINVNCPEFVTYPVPAVEDLCNRYGFLNTKYIVKNDLVSLRKFLEECAETGSWGNMDVEGFVIRCKTKSGNDYFFKYKFEEPYLMYREWREATKAYLSSGHIPKIRRNKTITLKYLKFVGPILDNDPILRKRYLQNHGIINLRQRFLDSVGQTGMEIIKEAEETGERESSAKYKYAIVPVATIGCGKTTLAVALSELTGWGHVQNDDNKAGGKGLVMMACGKLKEGNVVFVDRNNHQIRERKQIIDDMTDLCHDDLKFICLNFLPDGATEDIYRITRKRVTDRGDNHQTITGLDDRKINGIMRGFANRFQRVNTNHPPDSQFDTVIDLDVVKGTRANLETVLQVLRETYRLVPEYSDEDITEAMNVSMAYKPEINFSKTKKFGKTKLQYFHLAIDSSQVSMVGVIDALFELNQGADRTFWDDLKAKNRVQSEFHVTVAHSKQKSELERKIFQQFKATYDKADDIRGKVGNVIISEDVTEIEVVCAGFDGKALALQVKILDKSVPCANSIAHVTIGTDENVPPVHSGAMLNGKCTKIEWNVEPKILKGRLSAFISS